MLEGAIVFAVVGKSIGDKYSFLWSSNSYPNDSEKLMLASQTGLTKNQVISLELIPSGATCFHCRARAYNMFQCMGFHFPLVQVSNWFINARVRLWKPMIEEMYKEEFADSSEDSNPLIRGSITDEDSTNLEDE